ncbi:hypothetical protein ACN6LA_001490, partial [Streptomyces sp. SAS_269]|uniref:hypothetical protein n=1 Tax=Streptomyces sp. SAS_269 TaxID=3412749 RepID=UPI00403C146D
ANALGYLGDPAAADVLRAVIDNPEETYLTRRAGFPWDFSINYHLYRQVFPLTALGRYLHGDPFERPPLARVRRSHSDGRKPLPEATVS